MTELIKQKYKTKQLKLFSFIAAWIQFVLQTGGKLIGSWATTAAGFMMLPSALISINNSYRRLGVIAANEATDPKQGYRQQTEKYRLRGQIASDSLKLTGSLLSVALIIAIAAGAGSLASLMLGYTGAYLIPGILMLGVSYRLAWNIFKQQQSAKSPEFEGKAAWTAKRSKKTASQVLAFTLYALSLGLTLLAPVFPEISAYVVLAGYISSGITAIILGYWTKDHYQGLQTLKAQLPALKKTETPNDSPKNTNTTLIFSRVSPIEDIKSDPVPSLDNPLTF